MLERGTIVKWFYDRGFGFIRLESQGFEVFVHVTAFNDDPSGFPPAIGQKVSFTVIKDKGKMRATRVTRDAVR